MPGGGGARKRAAAPQRRAGSAGGAEAGGDRTLEGFSNGGIPEGLGGVSSGGGSPDDAPAELLPAGDAAASDSPAEAPGSEPPSKRTKRGVAATRMAAPGAGAAARVPDQAPKPAPDQAPTVALGAEDAGAASERGLGSNHDGERDAPGGGSSSSSEDESEFRPSSGGPGSSGWAGARPQRARRPSIKARSSLLYWI